QKKNMPRDNKSELGYAILVGVALLLAAGGAIAAAAALFGRAVTPAAAGVLAFAALLALVLQAAVGFPVNNKIHEEKAKMNPGQASASLDKGMENALKAMIDIRAERTPWFYLELLALGVPAVLYWAT